MKWPRIIQRGEPTDTTDVEEWDEWAKANWPCVPRAITTLLFLLGCRMPYQ